MNSKCLFLLISPLPVFTKHANCAKGILVKAIGDMGECLYNVVQRREAYVANVL